MIKKKNPEYVKRGKQGIATIRKKAGDDRLSRDSKQAVASRENNQKQIDPPTDQFAQRTLLPTD